MTRDAESLRDESAVDTSAPRAVMRLLPVHGKRRLGRPRVLGDADLLAELHVNPHQSIVELARRFGCSARTVGRLMRDLYAERYVHRSVRNVGGTRWTWVYYPNDRHPAVAAALERRGR